MFSVYVNKYKPISGSSWSNGNKETLLFSIPNQNGDIRPFLTATVNDEMGNAGSFEFTVSPESVWYDIWKHMRTLVRVEYDGDTIFYGRVLTIDRDMFRNKRIHCEGAFTFFMDSLYEGTEKGTEMMLSKYISDLVAAHNECMADVPEKLVAIGHVPGNYLTYIAVNLTNEEEPEETASDSVANNATGAPTYTITVSSSGGGRVSASAATATAGTVVSLTAVAYDGYKFKNWIYNSAGSVTTMTGMSFIMPPNNVSLTGVFAESGGGGDDPNPPGIDFTETFVVREKGSNTNLFNKDKHVITDKWITTKTEDDKIVGVIEAKTGYKIALIPMEGREEFLISNGSTTVDISGIFGFVLSDKATVKSYVEAETCKTETIYKDGYVYKVDLPESVALVQQVTDDNQKRGVGKGYKQVKEWLEELVNDYGGFMRLRYVKPKKSDDIPLYLDWLKLFFNPKVSDQTLSVSSNVVDLSDTVEVNNIFTHVIPVGKNNKYIYDGGGGGGGGGGTKYNVTVSTDGHGTASASVTQAAKGVTVTVSATPNIGYWFDHWVYNSKGTITTMYGNPKSFVMPNNDVSIRAVFAKPEEGETLEA